MLWWWVGLEVLVNKLLQTKHEVYKSNGHPVAGHEGPEREKRYSSTLSLTSALDGVGGQRLAPAALPPGKRTNSNLTGGWVDLGAGQNG